MPWGTDIQSYLPEIINPVHWCHVEHIRFYEGSKCPYSLWFPTSLKASHTTQLLLSGALPGAHSALESCTALLYQDTYKPPQPGRPCLKGILCRFHYSYRENGTATSRSTAQSTVICRGMLAFFPPLQHHHAAPPLFFLVKQLHTKCLEGPRRGCCFTQKQNTTHQLQQVRAQRQQPSGCSLEAADGWILPSCKAIPPGSSWVQTVSSPPPAWLGIWPPNNLYVTIPACDFLPLQAHQQKVILPNHN